MKFNDYILYTFLKKLYFYSNDELNGTLDLFRQIPYDYIIEYLKPIIYVFDNIEDKNNVIKFIKKYHKNCKNYPKKYKINKIELKTIKLILNKEMSNKNFYKKIKILNKNNLINDDIQNKTNFMYNKAVEYVNNYKNKR